MALLNEPITIGSAAEVSQRLLLWAKRDGSGLARVEYSSEFSRQQVVQALQTALAEAGIGFTVIELPTHQTAPEVVQFLLQKLSTISGGVVSVSGFAGAFQAHDRLESSLRVVNFNREALTAFPLRQVWWMTPVLLQVSLHAMPDLHGWFSPQLTLAQSIRNSQGNLINPLVFAKDDGRPLRSNVDDARQRCDRLLTQLAAAQSAGAADIDLLTTYLLPALASLAEVGAQKELRHLTSKFEALLNPLKLLSAATNGENSPANIATHLNTLADLYESQGRYGEAEPLFLKALEIWKAELGDRHPDTATSLNNLALLYDSQGRYGEAEPLYVEALEICKAELGDQHPDTASSLFNLAALYHQTQRHQKALSYIQQALNIY
ncbi:MAG: tetratricopeptide repeat protein, partial [Phormidesmis sp.]